MAGGVKEVRAEKMNVGKTEVMVCMREGRQDLEILDRKNIKLEQIKKFKYFRICPERI